MSEYRVTQRGKTCDVCQELDRLERFGLIEKVVSRETGKTSSLRKVVRFHVKHRPPESDDDDPTGSCRYTESTSYALRNHL